MIALSDETAELVNFLFAGEDREAAARLLATRCGDALPLVGETTPLAVERIRFAALKASGGDLDRLRAAVALAATDWRDLLVAAGFADDPSAHAAWRAMLKARASAVGTDAFAREHRLEQQGLAAALDEASAGQREGGIPIGSVLMHDGRIIGRGHNRRLQRGSVVLHAEMDALENAGRQPAGIYRTSTLFTTLSPCAMCAGAILLYGIPRVIVGENQTFTGEEALLRDRGVAVTVLQDAGCIRLMHAFITRHPGVWAEDIGEPS